MKYAIHHGFHKVMGALRSRSMALVLLGSAVMLVFFQFITSLNLYVIFDGDEMTIHQSYTSDTDVALSEAGIQISRDDYVYLPSTSQDGVFEVHIERSHSVNIVMDGEIRSLSTLGTTVGEVLERSDIVLGARDEVIPDAGSPIYEGMSISVVRNETRIDTVTEEIPFETVRNAAKDMAEGKEEVTQEGIPGQKQMVYEVSLRDGVETERRLVSETVTVEAKDNIVAFGTKKIKTNKDYAPSIALKENAVVKPDSEEDTANGGVLTTPSGEELRYTKMINVQATAYTTEGHKNKLTAKGTVARVGAIAVDPRVIPLGTKVYIEVPGGKWFYGYAVCEDTGGAIKGKIIDLFFNTEAECVKFGRRPAIVYILD